MCEGFEGQSIPFGPIPRVQSRLRLAARSATEANIFLLLLRPRSFSRRCMRGGAVDQPTNQLPPFGIRHAERGGGGGGGRLVCERNFVRLAKQARGRASHAHFTPSCVTSSNTFAYNFHLSIIWRDAPPLTLRAERLTVDVTNGFSVKLWDCFCVGLRRRVPGA